MSSATPSGTGEGTLGDAVPPANDECDGGEASCDTRHDEMGSNDDDRKDGSSDVNGSGTNDGDRNAIEGEEGREKEREEEEEGPPELHVDATALIDPSTVFRGRHPISIGPRTLVHPGCIFASYDGPIVIGSNNVFEERVAIYNGGKYQKQLVVGGRPGATRVMEERTLRSSLSSSSAVPPTSLSIDSYNIIGIGTEVQKGCHLEKYIRVGARALLREGCRVGRGSEIGSGVDVTPHSSLAPSSLLIRVGRSLRHSILSSPEEVGRGDLNASMNKARRLEMRLRAEVEARLRLVQPKQK